MGLEARRDSAHLLGECGQRELPNYSQLSFTGVQLD